MNRLVYLWELDSAKYTKEDILLGQNKLFDEIVGKGNQVVIAFNQLSGSPAFLCALNDKHFFECIVKLFRYGYIRLVRYETQDDDGNTIKVRTAAQYMILSIEKAMKGTYRFPKWIFCDEDGYRKRAGGHDCQRADNRRLYTGGVRAFEGPGLSWWHRKGKTQI